MIKLKNKKEKGITLVALAVTVTVMLILGSVSINVMFGEKRSFKKSKGERKQNKGNDK